MVADLAVGGFASLKSFPGDAAAAHLQNHTLRVIDLGHHTLWLAQPCHLQQNVPPTDDGGFSVALAILGIVWTCISGLLIFEGYIGRRRKLE